MRKLITFMLVCSAAFVKAQQIDSIYVDLYTDSLKKGTYNYINIDGLLSNGHYLPLDSTQLIFAASAGKFSGNSLWIDTGFKDDKVTITVTLRKNPALFKQFDMYVKKKPDNEKLKTAAEIMEEIKRSSNRKKKGS